uniref:Uncharacterized protein n=1 Tax=Panagrolaimus sp. ES5 TaxID=591445 RepID=A0AC34FVN4_9BILA
MMAMKDFEEDLSEIKQFFVASGFVHPEYFEKLEYLLSNVKSEVQEHIEPLSVMSFMPSLLTTPTSKSSSIAFSTEDYRNVLSSSSSKNEELGIGSATTRSLSETSILSDSTQTSSIGCDSVVSTQTSVSVFDTVDPTQASATDLETVESTQASVSKESVGPSTSVSSYCSIDLECDKTQNSDPSVKTAISPQSSSSLKTALSLHDTCSNDSSSTVAI